MDVAMMCLVALLLRVLPASPVQAAAPEAAAKTGGWIRIEAKPLRIDGRLHEPTCSQAEGTDAACAIQHRGWDNTQVILHWMRRNVARPARLLVTGSSAGAYGAATHYASLRAMYPRGSAVFLGDAGQGVTTPDLFSKRNTSWNYRLPAQVFGRDAQLSPEVDMVARLAAHFPRDRFAQYTTTYDGIQRAFYGMMGAEKSCDAWTVKMADELTRRQSAPNFRSYLAKGETHTILRSPLLFTEESGGSAFTEWFRELVAGPAPSNTACTDCLAPPARCAG